jgi:hypothetical protein
VVLQCTRGGLGSRADHADVDAPLVHLGDGDVDAVVALVEERVEGALRGEPSPGVLDDNEVAGSYRPERFDASVHHHREGVRAVVRRPLQQRRVPAGGGGAPDVSLQPDPVTHRDPYVALNDDRAAAYATGVHVRRRSH